ncbi:MAG: 1,4-dihydroxy-2-naphthoate octaprenyltransferase [Prevotella sp.]|jgi:1,4-dihydroxy-2-naphthoate octaprenyltransferase
MTKSLTSEENVRTNSFHAWVLAARPKTLTGAAVPVMIGAALATKDTNFAPSWLPMVLCFLFAFIMQIDANLVNDYFDYKKGNDDDLTRLGPKRACTEGWITPQAMRIGIAITTTVACLVGLPLVLYGGLEMILVGALCVLFCFLYTISLSYLGMGDILVLVFFGIIPVMLTYYLCLPIGQQHFTWEVFVASISCGLVIDTLLVVNNFRDIDNDKAAGKKTLIVKIGAKRALMFYNSLGSAACILGLVFYFYGHKMAFFLPCIYLYLHYGTYQEMVRIKKGRELNKVLGLTARNMFVYGLCVAIGVLLS